MIVRFLKCLPLGLVIVSGCSGPQESAPTSPVTKSDTPVTQAPSTTGPASADQPTTPGTTSKSEGKTPHAPSGPATSTTGVSVSASAPPALAKPETPAQGTGKVPNELKNEAYDYYGLANDKPMDLELKDNLSTSITTGTQLVTFESYADGVARFKIEHTGNLSAMGTEEVGLSKDGVTVLKGPEGEKDSNPLELPPVLTPGYSWTNHMQIEGRLDITGTEKIVGPQDVTTPLGTRHAILATLEGTGTINGQKGSIDIQAWYARGLGMVKSVITQHLASGKTEVQTLEEAK